MKRSKSFTLFSLITGLLMLSAMFFPVSVSQNPEEEAKGTPLGWSNNINLSNDPGYRDLTSEIAIEGNNIHVVWNHNYDDIYYSKSINGGISWSQPELLFHSSLTVDFPHIGVSGNYVHVVWRFWNITSGFNEVLYSRSVDNGETWSSPRHIFNITSSDGSANGIYVNNSNIHVISFDLRENPNGDFYYRRSLDGGQTFDNGQGMDWDRRITYTTASTSGVRFNGDGSTLTLVYGDEIDGDFDPYFMISRDNGQTWENGLGTPYVGREISETTSDCYYPTIAINNTSIHFAWVEQTWPGPDYTLYYRNSTDSGMNWNSPQQITGPWPGITKVGIDVESNSVHLTWGDERIDGVHDEIFYKNSTDGGVTWSTDLRLTFNLSTDSFHPKIVVENDIRHIVWFDRFPSNDREIYYKRYPDFPPDPTYNISLDEGWNLVSLPLEQPDESLDQVLQSINGKWDYIQVYDAINGVWQSNATFKPDQLNDFNMLNHKQGFWINITEPGGTILTISGYDPPSTSINLYAGWNLVGYPSLTNETVANSLWGTGADRVEVFDEVEPYRIREVGPTYLMKPGEGYWVHVPMDTVWLVDW